MLSLRHGEFTQRLKIKAESRGKFVETEFEEHGTSRSCSNCGHANHDLGDSKVFTCSFCSFQADRDVNAGKNQALKYLVGKKNY